MQDKVARIDERYEELNRLMADPEIQADPPQLTEYAREQAEIEEIVTQYRRCRSLENELDGVRELAESSDDPDMAEMAREEVARLEGELVQSQNQLKHLLLPRDPNDDKNVIVEIRAGTGGDEAGLFAADLYRMYTRYAETHRWHTEIISSNESGIGGFKEVIFEVKGKGAYSRLKYESGVHRVQRVPTTEAQGRIHTSTATVVVMPEVDEISIHIRPEDVREEFYRSAGAGGQNVQKNSTAVRLIHIPTGLVVACQDERSQLKNRMKAMSVLRARLFAMEEEKRQKELGETRLAQIGTGERAEKIRTYNFPQSRVTDHRIGLTSYRLQSILNGDLDEFIDELATADQAQRLGEGKAAHNGHEDDE